MRFYRETEEILNTLEGKELTLIDCYALKHIISEASMHLSYLGRRLESGVTFKGVKLTLEDRAKCNNHIKDLELILSNTNERLYR